MKTKGFTIIEVIMVIVVVAALAAGTAPFINAVIERWSFLQFRNEAGTQARQCIDWMLREIRAVKDKDGFNVADSSRLKFTNSEGESIDYYLSGTALMRNSDGLADDIQGLQFEYRDAQNNILGPLPLSPGNRKKIWLIDIGLTAASGEESLTLKTSVFPRNVI